jgi:L-fuconolactonase
MPAMRWVLDHIAKPEIATGGWEPWASEIAALAAASPNCHVKLSGMVTEADWAGWTPEDLAPYARHALDCFGPARTMLGSDWPVCLLAGSYQRVMDTARGFIAHLPPAEQEQILWRTAAAAYRLSP